MRHFFTWAPAAICVVFICLRAPGADLPDPNAFRKETVREVRYDPPQQPLTPEQLARIVPLKPNQQVTPAEVRDTIKQLYATGRYSYVEVDAQPAAHGVSLVVRTRPQWFVGTVEVGGKLAAPPNRGQLANATRLELGQPFNDGDLKTAIRGMQSLLRRNGFFQAVVDARPAYDAGHQQISYTFVVQPGTRARLTEPVISGDTRIPKEELAEATKYKHWFRWRPATEENVHGGVRRIRNKYAKDNRLTSSVRMRKENYDAQNNRAQPVIEANGGPKIKIDTVGAKISEGKLKRYVPVFDEQSVNRDLLVIGARNLRDYYQNQGYFEAEVDFQRRQTDPDHEQITYVVTPGTRHKLVDVTVKGNHYFTTRDIRERMFLQPAGFLRLRHGRYSAGFVTRDEDAITALYHANGFRQVQVSTQTVDDYRGKTGDVAAIVTIDEGPQYFVSDFELHGVKQFDAHKIVSMLACVPGEPYSENNIALDRDYIIRQYQSAGFPDASFSYSATPGPGPHQLRVDYYVTEGEKRYVRGLLLSGMRVTRPRLVDPNILIRPGDPLSWTQMGEMQRRLYNLGVFDKVDMAIQNPSGDTQEKYVLYHLEEGHRYAVSVGAGAEIARIGGSQYSLDNPAGQTGFSPRGAFDISRLNMWGLGHTLSLRTRYSTLESRAILEYLAPRYRNVEGRNITLTAMYDNSRDVRTFSARRLEGSAQLSQKISKPTSLFWRFSYRDSRVNASTLKINPLLIPLYAQPARVGVFSMSLIQDRRDDPANAHRGIYNTLDGGIASGILGSHTKFFRFLGRNSWYHPIGNSVLASNTEFGVIAPYAVQAGVDPTQSIPLPERFFGGGSTSNRGFPDFQAGPRDLVTGFPLGGNALFFHTTEYRFPFIGDNIGGVFFHDMGNVYSNLSSISFRVGQRDVTDFNYMVHAVGFGIRYSTPLGPVRVDLAYSINPPTFYGYKGTIQELLSNQATRVLQNVSHFQFFFSIGQAF